MVSSPTNMTIIENRNIDLKKIIEKNIDTFDTDYFSWIFGWYSQLRYLLFATFYHQVVLSFNFYYVNLFVESIRRVDFWSRILVILSSKPPACRDIFFSHDSNWITSYYLQLERLDRFTRFSRLRLVCRESTAHGPFSPWLLYFSRHQTSHSTLVNSDYCLLVVQWPQCSLYPSAIDIMKKWH